MDRSSPRKTVRKTPSKTPVSKTPSKTPVSKTPVSKTPVSKTPVSKTSSKTPRKSLAIPKNTPPDDYRAYVEHPEVATLNQIMLHYLDIEEILKLYSQNHEQFETQQALDTLAKRFELPAATTFKQLLRAYDMKYATVRSYLYDNRDSMEILLDAALEGNIQAFYNQLKLYPKLRKEKVYTQALDQAAEGGHEVILELLFELGAKDKYRSVLTSAAKGGQLALVLKELDKGVETRYIAKAVHNATSNQHKDVAAALLDYLTNDRVLDEAMAGAGESGDTTIIDYVISRGGNDYSTLIEDAAASGHFDIVRKYWSKLPKNFDTVDEVILRCAVSYKNLDMIKFLVEGQLVSQEELEDSLGGLKRKLRLLLMSKQLTSKKYGHNSINKQIAAVDSIIVYLESKGVERDESSEETMSD